MTIGVTPIKYAWKNGFPCPIDPNIAGRELERLAARDQEVVPITLVEESRPQDAPLHPYFEWDDGEAATLYREGQAKQLIRSIEVTYVRNDTEEPLPPVRAYVSVIDDPGFEMYAQNTAPSHQRHYRPMIRVMSDEDLREQYKRQAFESLVVWRQRYRDIEDFTRIFVEIDAFRAHITDQGVAR